MVKIKEDQASENSLVSGKRCELVCVLVVVANNKAGEEEKPLTYSKIKQTNKQ